MIGVVLLSVLVGVCACDVDPVRTLVWGPGLEPHRVILPVRYFFIHAVNQATGQKYKTSTESKFEVEILGVNLAERPCVVATQVLDRKDGSVIVRYQLKQTCASLKIIIKYKHKHISQSPYIIPGPVFTEDCYCPQEDIEFWLAMMQCPHSYPQINKDLEPFPLVNFTNYFKAIRRIFSRPEASSYCHYAVKDNQIYRQCFGQHVGFNMFMDAILLSLARKLHLPDMELLVNLGDWPLMTSNIKLSIPVFSWCGSEDSTDIVMPTYDLTETTLQAMSRVSLDMLSAQGNIDYTWDDKIEKAFWRGRDSRQERLDLLKISRSHPELIDAAITHVFFFRDKMDEIEPLAERISFFKFFDYKYQLNIDGTVAAYRMPYLMAGDSVILKQNSPYYEHFYNDLKPWKHFIPVKRDLTDLVEKIRWAKQHDQQAKEIAQNSRQYVHKNLMPTDIFCYHAVLFHEWSKRLVGKIVINSDMDKVAQPSSSVSCGCKIKSNRKDEL